MDKTWVNKAARTNFLLVKEKDAENQRLFLIRVQDSPLNLYGQVIGVCQTHLFAVAIDNGVL